MRMPQQIAAILFAGALSLSLSTASLAQRRGGGPGAVPQVLLAKLNLTADEQTKVQAANDAFRADSEKARALTAPDEKRAALKKAREDYKSAMAAALTPDQQKQLQGLTDEAKQYRGLGPIGNQIVGLTPPLSDDQKSKINAIQTKYAPDLEKARADLKTASDKATARQALTDVYKKAAEEVRAVLTPDQQKLLQPVGRKKKAANQ